MKRKGEEYIVCRWHKTALVYGAAGKWIDKGTLAAMEVFMDLPDTDRTSGDGDFWPKPVQCARMLIKWAEVHAESVQMSATFLRKYWSSEAHDDEDGRKASGIIAIGSAHSKPMAQGTYNFKQAKIMAQGAKATSFAVLGPPVPWPEPAELTEGILRERCNALFSDFSRKRCSPGEDNAKPARSGEADHAYPVAMLHGIGGRKASIGEAMPATQKEEVALPPQSASGLVDLGSSSGEDQGAEQRTVSSTQ